MAKLDQVPSTLHHTLLKTRLPQCIRHQSRTNLLVSIEMFLRIEQRQSEEFRIVAVDETVYAP